MNNHQNQIKESNMRSKFILAIASALAFTTSSPVYAQETLPPDDADKVQAEAIKKQVDDAQKQAKDEMQKAQGAMREAAEAHARAAKSMAESGFRDRLVQFIGPGQARSLVVLSSEADPKVQAQLEEDLGIMAYILDKALEERLGGQNHGRTVMGINLMFGPSASARNLYLEGYGAVFILNVGFPLQAPAKSEQQKEEAPTNSTWEDARDELYGQHTDFGTPAPPGVEYSQDKVDRLKEALIESLKNAANIRDLKTDEWITLVVLGSDSGPGGRTPRPKAMAWNSRGGPTPPRMALAGGGPGGRSSIMTIRIRKSDAEGFAKGKYNLEEFRKRARISAYSGGGATGEGSGFMFGFSSDSDGSN
jgi:hypothetical protein